MPDPSSPDLAQMARSLSPTLAGVVIGMLPVTGITLPLVSYGGSSLTLLLTALGILLNISRYSR